MKIGDKTFMNLQEAVAWLLENNALPFQSTANYAGNTEIALSTLVNPSPAKVRVGSLIFFADSKVSTVIGVTSNSFICSDQFNDLVDDVVYVSNVALNASGHLIVTLSNGTNIDAGLIKQINSFSINASQHLIASFNDGTSTDLGAIFSGNITVSGNLTVTGDITATGGTVDANIVTGNEIVEKMSNYGYARDDVTNITREDIYAGACKNGNKLTLVLATNLTRTDTVTGSHDIGHFAIPTAVMNKIYPTAIGSYPNLVAFQIINGIVEDNTSVSLKTICSKSGTNLYITLHYSTIGDLPLNQKVYLRFELTLLLSDPLNS